MKIIKSMLLAVAACGGLFTVADSAFAQTWTQTSAPNTNWYSLASSADGTKLVAEVASRGIYTSTNSGATWTLTSAPSESWQGVASSADGVKLVATVNGGWIYTSTNSGITWTQQTNAPNMGWNGVASSADGSKLAAIAFPGGIYTSTNSGAIWTQTSASNQEWYAVASSADGTKLLAAGGNIHPPQNYNREVYLSTNSGGTWTQASLPDAEWLSVASSADGSEWMVGAEYQTGIWIGRTVPSPQLNLGLVSNNLALSWVVPSTNFVLQQTADLKTPNWVPLTNVPSLNPSNLQEQVTLPSSNGGGFFRLIAQ